MQSMQVMGNVNYLEQSSCFLKDYNNIWNNRDNKYETKHFYTNLCILHILGQKLYILHRTIDYFLSFKVGFNDETALIGFMAFKLIVSIYVILMRDIRNGIDFK